MNLKDLTAPECQKYRDLCNFTDSEMEVFNFRVKDRSIVEISMLTNQSTATINRRLRDIKRKMMRI